MNAIEKFNLNDTLSIVTGGAGLLGCKHAEALLDAGSTVIVLDNSSKNIKKLKHSLKSNSRLHAFQIDITDEKSILKLKEEISKDFKSYPSILTHIKFPLIHLLFVVGPGPVLGPSRPE